MNFSKLRCVPLLVSGLGIGTSLAGQVRPLQDSRPDRSAYLTILADANFSVRYANIPFAKLYSENGAGEVTQQQITNELKKQYEGFLAYMVLQEFPVLANTAFVGSYLSQYAAQFNPYLAAFAVANLLYNEYVVSDHTRENGYGFVVPADAWYTIRVWVPGDWNKPASMIKVFSHTESGTSQVYNYDQTNVSDRVETIRVFLRRGSAAVKVSVGSGTLYSHNAGHMESAALDNPSHVSWTEKDVPVNVQKVNLLERMPFVGATATGTVVYAPSQNLYNGVIGTVGFSNPKAALLSDPLPPQYTSVRMDIWGSPTPEQQEQLGIWKYLNLTFVPPVQPVFDGQTATFSMQRTEDFTSQVTVKGVYHLTAE